METSQIRQDYHRDCEAAINRMANMELFASYTYMSMAHYFAAVTSLFQGSLIF
uniref:Ferritin n=1 Tax=Anguilla anguilla TaxID=7936 RepID=A0A0E9QMU9_ANGAN